MRRAAMSAEPLLMRAVAAAFTTMIALFLIACGGGDGDHEGGDGGSAQERQTRVVVSADEGAFDAHAVYKAVSPGVVTVRSVFSGGGAPNLLDPEDGGPQGQGSGFVVSESGEIVTNAHVVTNANAGGGGDFEPADAIFVQFADRNQVPAEVVGTDPFADVALLAVEDEGLDLQPLELGSSADAEVGDPVAAIGSPFGQEQSLSVGVISATDRSIESLTRFTIDGAIQTDASINPGNSGGPLLDAEGRVIGINQQIRTGTGTNEGVGFAVPIELAERSVEQLRDEGDPSYAFMGVTTQSLYPQLADRLDLDVDSGALVVEVTPNSPADDAGLRAGDEEITFQGTEVTVGGDVIVAVDGERLVDESDLPRTVALLAPGREVTLEIIRDGEHEEIDLTLGERPTSFD